MILTISSSPQQRPYSTMLSTATVAIVATTVILLPVSTLAAQCTLCGDNIIPNGATLRGGDGGENQISCQSLLDDLIGIREGSTDCNRLQLASFQAGCCGENFLPRDACSLCPDGTPFRTSVKIPGSSSERRDLTCGDLVDEPSFLDFFHSPGDCSDTYLQRSAGWCECPGREVECHICPDGSQIPDPEKTEKVLYGWNCATFEYVTALFSRTECPLANQVLDFDASAFCCPHVVSPPTVCNFCPSTQVLGDPEKLITTDYGVLKCGDIAESLSLVPTVDSCKFAREKFNTEQCCVYPGVLPWDEISTSGTGAFHSLRQFIPVVLSVTSLMLAL